MVADNPDKDRGERRREALRRFMAARNLKLADWAKRAGLPTSNAITNFLNYKSESLNVDTYQQLARAESVSVSELIGDAYGPVAREFRTVYIRGSVQAGAWNEAVEWPRQEWTAVSLPLHDIADSVTPFALRVAGTSMNLLYREGDILVCVSLYDFHRPLRTGDRVIVQRRSREGFYEATCKEYRDVGGTVWLWPRSDDPEHQAPIRMPSGPDDPPRADGVEDVRITGVVVKSVRDETT